MQGDPQNDVLSIRSFGRVGVELITNSTSEVRWRSFHSGANGSARSGGGKRERKEEGAAGDGVNAAEYPLQVGGTGASGTWGTGFLPTVLGE